MFLSISGDFNITLELPFDMTRESKAKVVADCKLIGPNTPTLEIDLEEEE